MGWRPDQTPEARSHIPAPLVSYAKRAAEATFVTALYPAPNAECPITDLKLTESGFDLYFGEECEHFEFSDARFETDAV
jgi:hypothetical protein